MYNNFVDINLGHITENVRCLIDYSKCDIFFAVVKDNAYGHGAIHSSRAAILGGAKYLAVASLEEALEIRKELKGIPILVLGYVSPADFELASRHNITIAIVSKEQVGYLEGFASPLKVHLKFDSGMNRLGFKSVECLIFAKNKLLTNEYLELEGLFSHFATADILNSPLYKRQVEAFKFAYHELNYPFKIVHIENSASILFQSVDLNFCNGARSGIAIYGVNPNYNLELPIDLKPALSFYSRVSHIKSVEAGQNIGYGGHYMTPKKMSIATISVGYGQGLRRDANKYALVINKKKYKILGNICMDQLMVAGDSTLKVGDIVQVIGSDNRVEELARLADTIPYEILCGIAHSVKRNYLSKSNL